MTSEKIRVSVQTGRGPCGSRPGLGLGFFLSWAGALFLVGLPMAIRAELLDPFEETSGWMDTSAGGASLTLSTVSGKTGNALLLDYDFSNYDSSGAAYCQIQKEFNIVDLRTQGANALRFQYKAVGVANTLEVKFTDNDSTSPVTNDKLDYRFTIVPDGQWRTVTVPYPEFFTFDDGTDDIFQAEKAGYLAFVVVQKDVQLGGGTLWVDNAQLVRMNSFTYMLDSYETEGQNDRKKPGNSGGPVFTYTNGTGGTANLLYQTTHTVSGAKAAQFDFTVGSVASGSPPRLSTGLSSRFQPLVAPSAQTRLTFYMRGNVGGAYPYVEIVSANGARFSNVALSNYGTLTTTTTWHKFFIPLADFTDIDLDSLDEVAIFFATPGQSGRVYVDNMTFEESGNTEAVVRELDPFTVSKKESFWNLHVHELGTAELDLPFDFTLPSPSGGNRVFRLDYDFQDGSDILWAAAERRLRPNPLVERVFTFNYMGTGDSSNLEFKVEDESGSVYSRKVSNVTATGGVWQSFRIHVEDLSYLRGGTSLKLREVRRISVAVSGLGGRKGTLGLDNLYTGEQGGLVTPAGRGGLIVSLSVPDNPFSPNGDGSKDSARFIAELAAPADASVWVYNLRGGKVRQVNGGHFEAGPATVIWDGFNDDGELVENGIYFFRFKASSGSGSEDEIKQVIGVVR